MCVYNIHIYVCVQYAYICMHTYLIFLCCVISVLHVYTLICICVYVCMYICTQVVEWLLKYTNRLPSDAECQKCLLAPAPDDVDEASRSDLLHNRTKCLELIMKVCVGVWLCVAVCVCVCVCCMWLCVALYACMCIDVCIYVRVCTCVIYC